MTKDLSRAICEKCNIPYFNRCDDYHCEGTRCDSCICSSRLDFGKPENFVKLFELSFLNATLGFYLSHIYKIANRIDFLTVLNLFLNDDSYNSTETEREQIKQSIREEEWDYE